MAQLFYAQPGEIVKLSKDFYYFRHTLFEVKGAVELRKTAYKTINQYAKVVVNNKEWYIREIRSKSKHYKELQNAVRTQGLSGKNSTENGVG